jgi:hypothetical protein
MRRNGGTNVVNVAAIPDILHQLTKNKPIRFFLHINTCKTKTNPYNAPPLTGIKRLCEPGREEKKPLAKAN